MRHDSALKVIAFLRANLGRTVSILEVCQGIDLSYQPTHGHIRALEEWEVVVTERRGRRVCCALNRSDSAALWLALESEMRWRRVQGVTKRLGEALRADLVPALRSKLLAVIVALERKSRGPTVWVVVSEPSAKRQAREASIRVGEHLQRLLQVLVGTPDDLQRWLQDPAQVEVFLTTALPVYGRERFWELVLAGVPGSLASAPAPSPASPETYWEPDDDFLD